MIKNHHCKKDSSLWKIHHYNENSPFWWKFLFLVKLINAMEIIHRAGSSSLWGHLIIVMMKIVIVIVMMKIYHQDKKFPVMKFWSKLSIFMKIHYCDENSLLWWTLIIVIKFITAIELSHHYDENSSLWKSIFRNKFIIVMNLYNCIQIWTCDERTSLWWKSINWWKFIFLMKILHFYENSLLCWKLIHVMEFITDENSSLY